MKRAEYISSLLLEEGWRKAPGWWESWGGRRRMAHDSTSPAVCATHEAAKTFARLGEFQGIRKDGSPDGLLFPASLVIVGDDMFVTNLALPLTPAVGDEPEEEVSRYTVSRIKLPRHDD